MQSKALSLILCLNTQQISAWSKQSAKWLVVLVLD
jgi:hypothetical protein